jgi:hypothetical protein
VINWPTCYRWVAEDGICPRPQQSARLDALIGRLLGPPTCGQCTALTQQ